MGGFVPLLDFHIAIGCPKFGCRSMDKSLLVNVYGAKIAATQI
jgi:hypothetical protein